MLYETLSQPLILFYLLIVGFASGIIFDFCHLLYLLCNKNKIIRCVLDFFATIIVGVIFFVLILHINYGEIRLYEIITFALAIFLERILLGKILAKFIIMCYNFLEKLLKGLKIRFVKKSKNYDKKSC